jgi:hypothetical protein
MIRTEKRCPKCKEIKKVSEYYVCLTRYDGLRVYCKLCTSKLDRMNNQYFLDYYHKRYNSDVEFRKKVIKNTVNSQNRYPLKHKARVILQEAVRLGRVLKEPCLVCGKVRSEGHHRDYKKPLKVVWLCSKHHKMVDSGKLII